jgi:TetR/AcrR family transcriptional regulator, mexJK operon transcriptional repressor
VIITHRKGRPTSEDSEKLTERIVFASIAMFIEKGFAGTSIDALSSELGIAKRSIYSRFSSKAELFRAAANSYAAAFLERSPTTTHDNRAVADQLLDVCHDLLNYFLHPNIIAMERTLVAEANRFPEIVPVLEDVRHRAMSRLHSTIELIQPEERKDIAARAQLLWDLTIAPPMRAAALGLLPCVVTPQVLSITAERIAHFLVGLNNPIRGVSQKTYASKPKE